jgi:hypothetical protein
MAMNLKPLGDRLVVEPRERESTTASGLVLPETAKPSAPRAATLPSTRSGAPDRHPRRRDRGQGDRAEDPFENMGAQLLKEAATKTNDVAGDGTTTATVLAQAIVNEGLKNVTAGANPMLLKRGIEAGRDAVVAKIKGMATPSPARKRSPRSPAFRPQDPRSAT